MIPVHGGVIECSKCVGVIFTLACTRVVSNEACARVPPYYKHVILWPRNFVVGVSNEATIDGQNYHLALREGLLDVSFGKFVHKGSGEAIHGLDHLCRFCGGTVEMVAEVGVLPGGELGDACLYLGGR